MFPIVFEISQILWIFTKYLAYISMIDITRLCYKTCTFMVQRKNFTLKRVSSKFLTGYIIKIYMSLPTNDWVDMTAQGSLSIHHMCLQLSYICSQSALAMYVCLLCTYIHLSNQPSYLVLKRAAFTAIEMVSNRFPPHSNSCKKIIFYQYKSLYRFCPYWPASF